LAPAHALPAKAPVRPNSLGWRLQHFYLELRRRHVLRVAVSYGLVMWFVLQAAEVTFEPLQLPAWWRTALTILAIVGLPIVTVLAWAYDITPGGIVRDAEDAELELRMPRPRRSLAPALVAGVAAMAGVTGFAWLQAIRPGAEQVPRAADTRTPSVAVLPLVDMSPAGGSPHLGDALSEELSTRLAQVPGLRVAVRTSAVELKDRSLDVRKIGQSLGVGHVLEGSVRRKGDSLRVTVQLIDARTGDHVWAGNYDRNWSDVLALQDDIADAVTSALKVELSTGRPPAQATAPTVSVGAIEPYLAGLAMLRQPNDLSNLASAQQDFEAALAIDPNFAGAHAGLCRVGARLYDRSRDPAQLALAEQSCRRALSLDASLLDTARALAALYVSGGQFARAEVAYRKLLQGNPLDASLHIGLGEAVDGSGRSEEAEASFRRAIAVEPSYAGAYTALAGHLFERGRAGEAAAAYRKVTELAPASATAWSNLGGALQMSGNFAGASEAYRHSLRLEPSKSGYSNLGTTLFYLGKSTEAVANFESAVALGEHDAVVWGNLGDALWQIEGRRQEAAEKYRRAIELGERSLATTPDDPLLLAQLAYYYGRTGDRAHSARYLERAAAGGGDRVYVQYYRAVALLDRDDREAALEAIEELVGLGYPKVLLRAAPEFRPLWHDPRFREMVKAA
jgi:TolB-like protein/tetratricopeptide (TPR) repeat protein